LNTSEQSEMLSISLRSDGINCVCDAGYKHFAAMRLLFPTDSFSQVGPSLIP